MRNLFGRAGQSSICRAFRAVNRRTFSLVCAAHAWAAPMPMAVYSDEYDFADYVRYNLSAGVQGLVWSPEVRHAGNERDWARRMAASAFSAKMVLNNWQFPNPAWRQPDLSENERNNLLSEDNFYLHIARRFTLLRMALLPYLYTAYSDYAFRGISPVRSLAVDYPEDHNTHLIDDQWMLGDAVLVAPVTNENSFSDCSTVTIDAGHFKADDGVQTVFGEHTLAMTVPQGPAGLRGGGLALHLKQGNVKLRFLVQGELPAVSMRLREVVDGKPMQDMGALYKDNVLIADDAWSAYSFDFEVPKEGDYVLVLSKGYSLVVENDAEIWVKDLYVEQYQGDPDSSWQRMVYLPGGCWRDFWTGAYYEGGKRYALTASAERPLVFVKENTLLPLAEPVLTIGDDTEFVVHPVAYGDNPRSCVLYEDDGITFGYEKGAFSTIEISPKGKVTCNGGTVRPRYKIIPQVQYPECFLETNLN